MLSTFSVRAFEVQCAGALARRMLFMREQWAGAEARTHTHTHIKEHADGGQIRSVYENTRHRAPESLRSVRVRTYSIFLYFADVVVAL